MLKINRKTEYALMALHYLVKLPEGRYASVAEVARRCHIPEVLLAKILQKLKRRGLLDSTQGAAGGYALSADPGAVPLMEFLHVFEEQTALVDCMVVEPVACALFDVCEIRSPLAALNELIHRQLRDLTLRDVILFSDAQPRLRAGESSSDKSSDLEATP